MTMSEKWSGHGVDCYCDECRARREHARRSRFLPPPPFDSLDPISPGFFDALDAMVQARAGLNVDHGVDCPCDKCGARRAASAAWQARARLMFDPPLHQEQLLANWRIPSTEALRADIAQMRDALLRTLGVSWWEIALTDKDLRFLKGIGINPWK